MPRDGKQGTGRPPTGQRHGWRTRPFATVPERYPALRCKALPPSCAVPLAGRGRVTEPAGHGEARRDGGMVDEQEEEERRKTLVRRPPLGEWIMDWRRPCAVARARSCRRACPRGPVAGPRKAGAGPSCPRTRCGRRGGCPPHPPLRRPCPGTGSRARGRPPTGQRHGWRTRPFATVPERYPALRCKALPPLCAVPLAGRGRVKEADGHGEARRDGGGVEDGQEERRKTLVHRVPPLGSGSWAGGAPAQSRGHVPAGEPAPEARWRDPARPGPAPSVHGRDVAAGEAAPPTPAPAPLPRVGKPVTGTPPDRQTTGEADSTVPPRTRSVRRPRAGTHAAQARSGDAVQGVAQAAPGAPHRLPTAQGEARVLGRGSQGGREGGGG